MIRSLATALALILAAGQATAMPAQNVEGAAGPMMADMNGMALYTFDNDAAGVSNCVDGCAANWPPFAAAAGDVATGEWGIIERADGTMQWTYEGSPLYTFVNDKAPGDVTGDGVNEVWHLLRP